uniref:Mitotic-spindle organizing protein 1 n=1 Tax=Tetranychus urticae TaxID=32264 RepID=T1K2L1_TETUR
MIHHTFVKFIHNWPLNWQMERSPDNLTSGSTLDIIAEMSSILDTGLDSEILSICHRLLECGVSAKLLAKAFREIKNSKIQKTPVQ